MSATPGFAVASVIAAATPPARRLDARREFEPTDDSGSQAVCGKQIAKERKHRAAGPEDGDVADHPGTSEPTGWQSRPARRRRVRRSRGRRRGIERRRPAFEDDTGDATPTAFAMRCDRPACAYTLVTSVQGRLNIGGERAKAPRGGHDADGLLCEEHSTDDRQRDHDWALSQRLHLPILSL